MGGLRGGGHRDRGGRGRGGGLRRRVLSTLPQSSCTREAHAGVARVCLQGVSRSLIDSVFPRCLSKTCVFPRGRSACFPRRPPAVHSHYASRLEVAELLSRLASLA